MIKITQIIDQKEKATLKRDYLVSLSLPLDDYWEQVTAEASIFYTIHYAGEQVGYFAVRASQTLTLISLEDKSIQLAPEIMEYLISQGYAQKALVPTNDPFFLSLSLDFQKSVAIASYLFLDLIENIPEPTVPSRLLSFRLAIPDEIPMIIEKCNSPFENYYRKLVEKEQLFVLYENDGLIGIGERRVSMSNPQYAFLGVNVMKGRRNQGMGTYIISCLVAETLKMGQIPAASCSNINLSSKRILEKAGLVSKYRLLDISFIKEE